MSTQPTLVFDENGIFNSNFIENEIHVLPAPVLENNRQIFPKRGVFFEKDLTVFSVETGNYLVRGTDFSLNYKSEVNNNDVFASIVLLNDTITGNLAISLRYVGGDYSFDASQYLPSLVDKVDKNKIYLWDDIGDFPVDGFEVAQHQVPASTITTGFTETNQVIKMLSTSIATLADPALLSDLLNVGVTRDGNVKTLMGDAHFNKFDGYLKITLPAMENKDLIDLDIRITRLPGVRNAFDIEGGEATILINGIIDPANYNTINNWENTSVRIRDTNESLDIYLTYSEFNPVIYIGKFDKISGDYDFDELLVSVDKVKYYNNPLLNEFMDAYLIEGIETLPPSITSVDYKRDNDHFHDNIDASRVYTEENGVKKITFVPGGQTFIQGQFTGTVKIIPPFVGWSNDNFMMRIFVSKVPRQQSAYIDLVGTASSFNGGEWVNCSALAETTENFPDMVVKFGYENGKIAVHIGNELEVWEDTIVNIEYVLLSQGLSNENDLSGDWSISIEGTPIGIQKTIVVTKVGNDLDQDAIRLNQMLGENLFLIGT